MGLWRETFGLRRRGGKPEPGCAGCRRPGGNKLPEPVVTAGSSVESEGGAVLSLCCMKTLEGCCSQLVRKSRNKQKE